jgi:trimeric autotransporter adhesin
MRKTISFVCALIVPVSLYAWTGPSAAPPGNNVSAPVNIGSADQFKPGIMGANIINIYGASQYLSFGNTTGATGFGIRNNAGYLEFKNSGGSWNRFGPPFTAGLSVSGTLGTLYGGSYRINANGDNATGGGILIADDGGFFDYNDGWVTFNGSTGIKIAGNNGAASQGNQLQVNGRIDANSYGGSGGIISTGNYGGTGTAAYFPSGIWANGASSWLYGTIYTNGAIVDTAAGTVRDAGGGWLRTYGATGWYSQTYGGGWHMSDTTWLRAYGGKYVYTPGAVRGDYYVASNQFCDPSTAYCSSAYGLWYVHTYYYSDKRLKKDIKDMSDDYGLGAIMKLRPIQFTWKDKTSSEKLGPQIGLIAQEVEQVIPEAVDTMPNKEITREDGTKETIENPKSVTYQNLVVPLIKSVQDLKALNDAQQREIDALKEQVKQLQSR